MKVGIHLVSFGWAGGPEKIGPVLAKIGRAAEQAGVDSLSLMDHYLQLGGMPPPRTPRQDCVHTGRPSGGRAKLGIGAARYQREHTALGVPFPPVAERFERLEETLQIVKKMWSEDDGPFRGRHYQLAETINSPQPLQRPHPPVMIGGGGERKTLRLVAKYADAWNLPFNPDGGGLDTLR
jgi:alkanesulfonate monooxygenase SsuD/methylene tetrahydromethanopterin reductase-like flavin-dependent oxidoreductase (luciferase family)